MRLKLIRFQKTHIIGRHDRATVFRRQCHRSVEVVLLPRAPGALQFQIEPVGEAALPLRQGCAGIGLPAVQQRLADVALATTRQGDDALRVLLDPGLLHTRPAQILALLVSARQQQHQVPIARLILGQQTQFVMALLIEGIQHVQIRTDNELES